MNRNVNAISGRLIFIEQSIGRGLRLPYGKRTGVAAVDRLSIIAHASSRRSSTRPASRAR